MNILISNDDGYFSEGIQTLKKGLIALGHKVFLVAPDRDNSACGMSITVRQPITVREIGENEYAISGTPVDAIVLATGGLVTEKIDIVISGINNGANLCDDVFYSGTVAAAMEARRFVNPAIALSIPVLRPQYYETAVYVVGQLLDRIDKIPNKQELAFLNVNVPDVAIDELNGMKASCLGMRLPSVKHKTEITKKGVMQCWIGPAGDFDISFNSEFPFDHECIKQGYASVTPIKAEWVNTPYINDCAKWLADS